MSFFQSRAEREAEEKAEREAEATKEAVEEHNRGQDEGAKADVSDRLIHNTVGHIVHSEEFNKGWDNATRDKWPV